MPQPSNIQIMGEKISIFCFAQLLLQILVDFQNQGTNLESAGLEVFEKHPLYVQNILELLMVFLGVILFNIGAFDGEQHNFWNTFFRFLLFSSPTNQLTRK